MTTTAERITEAGVNNSNVKSIPRGTVLMSFKLTLGRVAIAGMDLYSNEAIAAFYPDTSHVFAGWLFHVLPRVAASASAEQAVKGQTLNKDKLQRLKLLLPPLPEQRRIAEILDTADDAIRQSEQLIAKLKAVKAGLLHDLLTRGLDEQGCLRDPEAHPEQFELLRARQLPCSWAMVPLESVVPRSRPICYGVLKPGDEHVDGVPLVRILDIENNIVNVPDLFRISRALDAEFARSRLVGGELLVSIQGTIGRVAIAPPELRNANISRTIARVAVDSQADVRYLRYWLMSSHGQAALRDAVLGTTRDSLNIGALRCILLPLPQLREQHRIADVMDAHDARIRAEEAALDKLRQLKRGLMDDLLTGRVRVPLH